MGDVAIPQHLLRRQVHQEAVLVGAAQHLVRVGSGEVPKPQVESPDHVEAQRRRREDVGGADVGEQGGDSHNVWHVADAYVHAVERLEREVSQPDAFAMRDREDDAEDDGGEPREDDVRILVRLHREVGLLEQPVAVEEVRDQQLLAAAQISAALRRHLVVGRERGAASSRDVYEEQRLR